jgi:hypothetical protein
MILMTMIRMVILIMIKVIIMILMELKFRFLIVRNHLIHIATMIHMVLKFHF